MSVSSSCRREPFEANNICSSSPRIGQFQYKCQSTIASLFSIDSLNQKAFHENYFFPKEILQTIFKILKMLVGKWLFPATETNYETKKKCKHIRLEAVQQHPEFDFKQIWIKTGDDALLEAVCIIHKKHPDIQRWVIKPSGPQAPLDKNLQDPNDFLNILKKLNSNALLVNNRSIGASVGTLTREGLFEDIHSILSCAEDSEGLNAKEIIVWSHSTAAAIVNHSLYYRQPAPNIKYLIVADSTFSKLSSASPKLSWLINISGWDIDASQGKYWKEFMLYTRENLKDKIDPFQLTDPILLHYKPEELDDVCLKIKEFFGELSLTEKIVQFCSPSRSPIKYKK